MMFKFLKSFFFTGILFLIFVGAQHVVPLQRDVFAASASNAAVANAVATYSETTYFIHQDNLGSVVAVSTSAEQNSSASAVLLNSYSSYGSPSNETMEQWNPPSPEATEGQGNGTVGENRITERAYTGQIRDASTTLQYYNARYYDSSLSRFISSDSVQGGNRYSYVGGNPISNSDPTGNMIDLGGSSHSYDPYSKNLSAEAVYDTSSPVYQAIEGLVSTSMDQYERTKMAHDYLVLHPGDLGTQAVAAADIFTGGQVSQVAETWNQWVDDNRRLNSAGDYDFGTRFKTSVNLGVTVTALAAGPAKGVQNKWVSVGKRGGLKDAISYIAEEASYLPDDILSGVTRKYGNKVIKETGLSDLQSMSGEQASAFAQKRFSQTGNSFSLDSTLREVNSCGGICTINNDIRIQANSSQFVSATAHEIVHYGDRMRWGIVGQPFNKVQKIVTEIRAYSVSMVFKPGMSFYRGNSGTFVSGFLSSTKGLLNR